MIQEKDHDLSKIIVIQGNSPVGPMVQKVLEKAGHDVVLANAETERLTPTTESPPSLVITDLLSGNIDHGLNTLRHVHEVAPQAKIIALLSGVEENQPGRQVVAKQPGVFRVLDDPFEVGGLLEAMQEAIEFPH